LKNAVHYKSFALPPTPENLHFLFSFSKVLMESDSFHLNGQESAISTSKLKISTRSSPIRGGF